MKEKYSQQKLSQISHSQTLQGFHQLSKQLALVRRAAATHQSQESQSATHLQYTHTYSGMALRQAMLTVVTTAIDWRLYHAAFCLLLDCRRWKSTLRRAHYARLGSAEVPLRSCC